MTAMSKTERWSWEHHPDRPGGRIALSAGGRDVILATGDGGRSRLEVSDDDARMIEALPELLSACRAAYAHIGERHEASDDDLRVLRTLDEAITAAESPPRLTDAEEAEAERLYRKLLEDLASGDAWGLRPEGDR
jgi:hypothetical protein